MIPSVTESKVFFNKQNTLLTVAITSSNWKTGVNVVALVNRF